MQMPILYTDRLRVRPLTMRDLLHVHRLFLDSGWADADQTEADALEERRDWLQWSSRNHTQLAALMQPPFGDRAIELNDGTFAGMVGVVPSYGPFGLIPHFAAGLPAGADLNLSFPEIGLFWHVHSAHRGQGYATEAAQAVIDHLFTQINLRRVVAMTEHDNAASIAVMRRLGMTITQNTSGKPAWLQVVGVLENTIQ